VQIVIPAGIEASALGALGTVAAAGSSSELVTWAAVLSPVIAAGFGAYLTFRLRQVHTIVNASRTALEERIAQLEHVIEESSDSDVPPTTRETGRL
jgi:hypothetical protein